jgi:glycosyltransferase involved in cell wall biosynthesis
MKKVDLVYAIPKNSPSVRNLKQSLNALDQKWEIREWPLRPSILEDNRVSAACEVGLFQFNLFNQWIKLNTVSPSDILIIHKPFSQFLPDMLLNTAFAEKIFTAHDTIVYSTYDATYINNEKKTKYLFEKSDFIFATSKAIKHETVKYTLEDDVAYVPPSIDTEFFNPNVDVSKRLRKNSLVLGWIGDADIHSGDISKIASKLEGLDLDEVTLRFLMGGGSINKDTRLELQNVAADIEFIDWVPWKQVPIIINSFDIGLAPLDDTPFNRARSSEKIREYMACSLPVVASNVGENKHLIPDKAGILAESSKDWKDAIYKLNDSNQRKKMGKEARDHVVQNYSICTISRQIESYLSNLLDNRDN